MRYLIVLSVLWFISCQNGGDHNHNEDGHSHENDGRQAIDYTVWTEKTELFVEFPALVVGEVSRFAAHFTILNGHQAVKDGKVTVSLISKEKGIRNSVNEASSPGIFTPSLQPIEAGICKLIFHLESPSYSDSIIIENVTVYSTPEEAKNDLGVEEESNLISFLKEQAWKMEFQTEPVLEKEVYQAVSTSGIWKVAPSDHQNILAPNTGQVVFRNVDLTEGQNVRKGQLLMTINSSGMTTNNLRAEIQKASSELEKAKSEYERKKDLHDSKIVSDADFEKTKHKYQVAKANYESLSEGYESGGKEVRAPYDGHIKSIHTSNGVYVEQGTSLMTITSHTSSLLEAQIGPSYNTELNHIRNIWYQPSEGKWSNIEESGGQILSVSKEVDASHPLLSVFIRVHEEVDMPEGSFTEVQIAFGESKRGLMVPETALLEDYGKYSIIVQVSGEEFERRNVVTGKRNGGEVEITKGLKKGEMVVTKGAYQVKMASMSGQAPAHGHAH